MFLIDYQVQYRNGEKAFFRGTFRSLKQFDNFEKSESQRSNYKGRFQVMDIIAL